MDSIKQKLLKIKALAEQGVEGEAIAARNQLAKLLEKHGMTIEDLCSENKKLRPIQILRVEAPLFSQILWKVTGEENHPIFTYKGQSKLLRVVELTDRDYIDFQQLFEFHRRQLAKERKKCLETLYTAYIHKHDIFGQSDGKQSENSMTEEQLRAIIAMMSGLENATFHKQIALQ